MKHLVKYNLSPEQKLELRKLLNKVDYIGVFPELGGPEDEYDCIVDKVESLRISELDKEGFEIALRKYLKNHFGVAGKKRDESFEEMMSVIMKWVEKEIDFKEPFFIRKPHQTVYAGFPLIKETETDGFTYGAITDFLEPDNERGCFFGDGFVEAPDGSRAGLVWKVYPEDIDEDLIADKIEKFSIIEKPTHERWGVYEVCFPKPVKTREDLISNFKSIIPNLKEEFKKA